MAETARQRAIARAYLREYVKRGKVAKAVLCEDPSCAKGGLLEAHHPDYSKPLEVLWLHRACHLRYHEFRSRGIRLRLPPPRPVAGR